jgi:hypothetical protein
MLCLEPAEREANLAANDVTNSQLLTASLNKLRINKRTSWSTTSFGNWREESDYLGELEGDGMIALKLGRYKLH